MKKNILPLLCLLILIHKSNSQKNSIEYYTSKAPFAMPKVELPKFANKTYNIKNYGAIADGKTLCTKAFASCH